MKIRFLFLTILYSFIFSTAVLADGFIIMGPPGDYTLADGSVVTVGDDGSVQNLHQGGGNSGSYNGGSTSSGNNSNQKQDSRSYRSNPTENVVVDDTLTESLNVTIPFSELQSIGGNGTQLDLYGIGMTTSLYNVPGNRTYLGNENLVTEFYSWLDKAKYKTDNLKLLIEKIKAILGVISGTLEGKTYMIFDEDVISSIEARKIRTTTLRAQKIVELIFFGIGILFILYGFLLVLSWVFDKTILPLMSETGLSENGMIGLITFGNLRADEEYIDKHSATFAKVCIFGFASIAIGAGIISPFAREQLNNLITFIASRFSA